MATYGLLRIGGIGSALGRVAGGGAGVTVSTTAMAAAEAVLRATVTSDAAATARQYSPPPVPTVGDAAYAAFKEACAKQVAEIEAAAGRARAAAEAGVEAAMGEVTAPAPLSMARA